jgi:hypothetical protein
LVLQIALSFGHIHVGNLHVSAAAQASGAIAKALHLTSAPSPQKSPVQHQGDDDDYCAICASIFLASTSLVAQPPQLPVRLGFERVAPSAGFERTVSASPPVYFQSRAPPAA